MSATPRCASSNEYGLAELQLPSKGLSGLLTGQSAAIAYHAEDVAVIAARIAEDAQEVDVSHQIISTGHEVARPVLVSSMSSPGCSVTAVALTHRGFPYLGW